VTMTDIDGLAIGSVVYSAKHRTADGTAAFGGMVFDVGLTDDGAAYVEVLDRSASDMQVQHKPRGGRQWKAVGTVGIRRLFLADLDLNDPEPPTFTRMQGIARQALISAGAEDIHTKRWELVVSAGKLLQAAQEMVAQGRAA